jgi:WD40 repeat protein
LISGGLDGAIQISAKTAKGWEKSALLIGNSGPVYALAVSPDGQTLASGGFDQVIRLWDLTQLKESDLRHLSWAFLPGPWPALSCPILFPSASLTGHTLLVTALAFAPREGLYSASYDESVRLWDLSSRRSRKILGGGGPFALRPDEGALAWVRVFPADESEIHVFARGIRRQSTLIGHRHAVSAVTYAPDGGTIASSSLDHTVRIWKPELAKPLRTFTGHEGWVSSVAFAPGGKLLASGSWDRTIKLWRVSD